MISPSSTAIVPVEVDLRDFSWMPIEIHRLRRSKAWLLCKRRPELAFYLINLWTAAWHEVPAASLEDDDDVLADLAMCEPSKWPKLREQVLRGWVKAEDGRLYHPVVAELARNAWAQRLAQRQRTEAARTARELKRQQSLREAASALTTEPATHAVAVSVTEHATASNGTERNGTEQTGDLREEARGESDRADVSGFTPTPAGAVCRALRQAGIPGNPSHPTLLELLGAGATLQHFVDAAPKASGKRDPFAYLLGVVRGQIADAATVRQAVGSGQDAQRQDASDWRETKGGVNRRAAELGLQPWDEIEPWPAFKARIVAEDLRRGGGDRMAA